jgi:TIR domain
MPVFISHRTADDVIARSVRDRLTNVHGITCYLDDLDKEAGPANQNHRVTALIVNRLNACTNLLALVTQNTRGSWWVPFEVGVARQAPRIITSYTNLAQAELPQFLTEWPVLRGDTAIDTFASYYKQQAGIVKRTLVEKSGQPSDGIAGVNAFHKQLKAALGQ